MARVCRGLRTARVRGRGGGGRHSCTPASPEDVRQKPSPRSWSWAALMQRAVAIDVLACPSCGGRTRLIATIHDPADPRVSPRLPVGRELRRRPTRGHPRYPLSRTSARPSRLQTWSIGAATRTAPFPSDKSTESAESVYLDQATVRG